MTGQLIFEELAPVAAIAPVKKNTEAGAPRLLRTLVVAGLRPDAVEHAAALVVALDDLARAERQRAAA